jgi:hypothetical protein
VTRPLADLERVAALDADGLNGVEIARRTGIPWSTLQKWRRAGIEQLIERRRQGLSLEGCDCRSSLPAGAYAHLLGLYLGDGTLCRNGKSALRLEISCDAAYPRLIDEAAGSIAAVLPVRVNTRRRGKTNCIYVSATSVHWRCLFPQHGAGRKHLRRIRLVPWQTAIVERQPEEFVRGLVNSDGCRVINRVGGHEYVRYHFANKSAEILELFGWACDLLQIDWRYNRVDTISIARRASVEILEGFVGPKS